MPEKINFTMDLEEYGDVFEASVPWKHDDGYYLCIDNSNTFTANQLIASVNNKKLRIRKIKPNAAKNENFEPTKFDGGIDCKIVLGTGWGICDVGTVKFNENGESIGLDGKVTMTVYESYLKNVEKGEIVAFFANPKWVFVDTTTRIVIGEILQGKKAFSGAWPTPEVFCKKLVAKKFNGDAVKGQIKFYTDNGLYVGDIKFSENGQGIQPITPENLELNEETLNVINFKKAFLSESSKSKNSEWNTLTSVSAICEKILKEPDFTTRLKNHLGLYNKFLNEDGLSYLKDTMKIALPEEYEGEAACLVYLNFLNNNKSDTNENDDPNTVSFERAFDNVWSAFDNGGNGYTIRIKGGDSEVAAFDYVIYKMIQDKLIKVYKINDQGALINPGAGSHKFEFVETGKAKCGLTIEINDEGEVTKSTCTSDNDDAGYKAFYDKAKLVLGEEEFKKQIIDSSGSMNPIASVDKIAEILKKKGLNPESRKYGDFANAIEEYIKDKDKETLENAKNEALKDLYTRLGQQLPKGMTIEKFDATDFAKKLLGSKFITLSKVKKKLNKLNGDKEKQIELLTRLLMRMKRKKDFEKEHKFGKIRYALGEREKTDPKIKKCFEAAGKYIVKNYDKMTESTLSSTCTNLQNIFKDLDKKEPWADNLYGKLKIEIVKNCWTSSNYQGPFKAIMGIIFASMAGIEEPERIVCACDALKKGGIKNSDQKTFLGQASQIRKSIKALCGRDGTTYATRKAVIKKLLVNDYKFIDGSHCNELFPPEPKTSK